MATQKKFKISSALKSIIGKELITSDFIAVFELVKNSFDAHATKVDLIFENLENSSPRIIIKDNGKGMDLNDLENKWLFVAYSAKKDGTEDFRDKIQNRRIHAGAKGIGRFSCDKLGQKLKIYSKKKTDGEKTNTLSVEWDNFEEDSKIEFDEISVTYERTSKSPYKIKNGTILEISELRETWDRDKLLKLKRSLEKLINPSQENDSKNFVINMTVTSEKANDKLVEKDEPWNTVNGPIENFLFENIGLKSTFINVQISKDGKKITTRLEDRGAHIYTLTEENPFQYDGHVLKNIEVSLFALNRAAKTFFTKHMGVTSREFGSVFLYKNGFRVHPFGELNDDSLGIDTRKAQGTSRYLGSRDLIGRIEINGENPDFQESSSRDGGLIQNEAYETLKDMFRTFCLRRLERYAVDIIKLGNLDQGFEGGAKQQGEVRSKILELVQNLTKSEKIIDVQYDPEVVDILGELSEKSLQNLLKNFRRIATETNNTGLEKEAKKAEKRLKELNKAREEAEKQAAKEEADRKKAEEAAKKEAERAQAAEKKAEEAAQKTEEKISQNLFLQSVVNQDVSNIVSLHHHIGIAAGTIENYIKNTTIRIKQGKPISESMILEILEKISYQAKKISTTTKFATKANFSLDATEIKDNLLNYIEEYLLNICSGVIRTSDNRSFINFIWENNKKDKLLVNFRPLEISIILDNLISNSRKAKCKNIKIIVDKVNSKGMSLLYIDDGKGIPKKNQKEIFYFSYTTTGGSGLGLYQTQNIINDLGGSITLEKTNSNGTTFRINIEK